MASENGAMASLSLGDFLTAEEPVWVWDALARRILWANQAGRDFWGAASLDALRAKQFSARDKSIQRLNSLASEPGRGRESVETLRLTAALGRRPVKCYVQSLEVAGGRPGLIVKALAYANGRDQEAADADAGAPSPSEAEGAGLAHPNQTTLDAIAARLKSGAKRSKRLKTPGKPKPEANLPAPVAALGVDAEELALTIREFCHELRNPLTVILGFAERLRDGASSGKSKSQLGGYAGNILESAELAMAILTDFSARILSPDAPPARPEPVEIRGTVESSLRMIAPLAKQAGIKVSRSTDRNLPALFTGERVLKQILLNLLMNAVRHQKTGGKIKITARGRKDGSVRLAVADNGKGMTKKEIKAVMKVARRKATQPPQPGRSGLGLPLVIRLVEGAGGRLAIDSARGKGTTIEMIFPAGA